MSSIISIAVYSSPQGAESIENILQEIENILNYTINRVLAIIKKIIRGLYVTLFGIGIVLWATGINSGRGRQLIIGAVVLAVVAEFL